MGCPAKECGRAVAPGVILNVQVPPASCCVMGYNVLTVECQPDYAQSVNPRDGATKQETGSTGWRRTYGPSGRIRQWTPRGGCFRGFHVGRDAGPHALRPLCTCTHALTVP